MKGYEFLIVLWFFATQFSKHRWSLFYAHGKALHSLQLHEMHSCFITAWCFLLFHLLGSEIDQFFLGLLLSGLDDKIKVFYLAGMITQFMFLLAVFYLHRIRRCLFSKVARICLYTTIIVMSIQMMELIARGYFYYHELTPIYRSVGWASNILAISALSVYPIRQTLIYFKKSKQI
ncbi:hypothetical protein PSECIP111951_00547 [Pseudoalteromonas holothuriae]|uniref:Rod shape-determining protein MreD n=1 Tax=Pseudoalteromonas holothuriae TaxID=2963714 RepID=A0ABM9GE61_9GAMM|nr:hypothetical protein PSECIP111951_00547 [Pseudoalteromonas sp. CIP111951]